MNIKTLFIAQLACVLILLQGCNSSQNHSQRDVNNLHTPATLFNANWQFQKSDAVLSLQQAAELECWQTVSLPHTANIEPRIVNNQWQGDAW